MPTAGICCIEGAVAWAAAGRKACLGGPAERLKGLSRFKGFKSGQTAALNTLKNSWTWPVLAAAGRV